MSAELYTTAVPSGLQDGKRNRYAPPGTSVRKLEPSMLRIDRPSSATTTSLPGGTTVTLAVSRIGPPLTPTRKRERPTALPVTVPALVTDATPVALSAAYLNVAVTGLPCRSPSAPPRP